MYESYTYEQVKSLPDDQKIIALKELKTIYPENKMLAEHWNVAHIAVSNMVGKYLEGKTVGRKKMTDEEKAQKKAEREAEKLKQQQEINQQQNQQQNVQQQSKEEIVDQEIKDEEEKIKPITEEFQPIQSQPKNNSFSIKLEKNMLGEETFNRLNGIANTLIKESNYKISLNIEEVEEV